MKTLYFGREAWRDPNFDVIAAKEWLGIMREKDTEIQQVLNKIARGKYSKILYEMDEFIKIFVGSKHASNPSCVLDFFKQFEAVVLFRVNLDRHGIDILRLMSENERWYLDPTLAQKLKSACIKQGLFVLEK